MDWITRYALYKTQIGWKVTRDIACPPACMHARMHARTHSRTHARTHACMHACMHAFTPCDFVLATGCFKVTPSTETLPYIYIYI